jgi:hypothetical protein
MAPTDVKLPDEAGNDSAENKVDERLIKNVTFFGDAALDESHKVYKDVWAASKLLAESGYTIVNGGGPGVMKAATDGAESVDGHTIAVYWQPKLAAYFEGKNLANVTDESETSSNYMMRTLGLIEKGDAYIVCKGGTGTMSEFGMVWALAKLYYGCHKPVILYGEFWDEFIESIQEYMYIDEIEVGVLYRASTPEEVLSILEKHENKVQHCKVGTKKTSDEVGFLVGGRLGMATYGSTNDGKSPQTGSTNTENEIGGSKITPGEDVRESYNSIASKYHAEKVGKLASIKQLEEFCELVNPPAKILDVGSGPGYDSKYLSDRYSVTAIEKSSRFVEISKYENPEIEVYNADIVDFPLQEGVYKGIWARDSLHHIKPEFRQKVVRKLADALVEDGVLYIIVRRGEKEGIEEKGVGTSKHKIYVNEFTVKELTDLCESVGLKLEKIEKTERSHHWLIGVFSK